MKIGEYEVDESLHYYGGEGIHEWVKKEKGKVKVGIDDLTSKLAKEISFISLQAKEGEKVGKGKAVGMLETAKIVLRLDAPVSGKIISFNKKVLEDPSSVNDAPFENWIFEMELADETELEQLVHGKEIEEWMKKEIEKYA